MDKHYLQQLNHVVTVLKRQHSPHDACAAVDRAVQALVGHRLFTVLYVAPGGDEVARIYSSDPVSYPLRGRKRMGPTPWGERVIKQGRAYVGNNDDDIRWAFPDHELIRSLGLGATLNIGVAYGGRVVGTLNILDRAGQYCEDQIALIEPFGVLLAPMLIEAAGSELA